MKKAISLPIVLLAFIGVTHQAQASSIGLSDWCVNLNGDISSACNGVTPSGTSINLTKFDQTLEPGSNGLGTITVSLLPGNNQHVSFYADYDLDYAAFGSFDDSGITVGTLPAGWSYSLNDPNVTSGTSAPTGFVLFDQFSNNSLDNTNHVGTPSGPPNNCCDVAFALSASGLNVPKGGSGTVTFTISQTAPAKGFYIKQTNQDMGDSIYLQESVDIPGGVTPTPEPSTFVLGLDMIFIAVAWRRRRASGSSGFRVNK